MGDILELSAQVERTVKGYVAASFDSKLIFSENSATHIYSVIVAPNDWKQHPHVMVMAQVIGQFAIVITDTTDRPLEDARMEAGIPRTQIVVAHRGEPVPVA